MSLEPLAHQRTMHHEHRLLIDWLQSLKTLAKSPETLACAAAEAPYVVAAISSSSSSFPRLLCDIRTSLCALLPPLRTVHRRVIQAQAPQLHTLLDCMQHADISHTPPNDAPMSGTGSVLDTSYGRQELVMTLLRTSIDRIFVPPRTCRKLLSYIASEGQ